MATSALLDRRGRHSGEIQGWSINGGVGSVIQSNSQVYSSTTPAASSSGVISSKVFSLRVFSELYSEPNA